MPNFGNRRNLVIGAIFLFLVLPIALSLLLSKSIFFQQDKNLSSLAPASNKYQCPSEKKSCQEGKDITKDNLYVGFGLNLKPQKDILASMDGLMSVSKTILPKEQGSEELLTIYIDDEQNKLRAIYFYKGNASGPRQVFKGELIGKSLEKISAYDTSLIFQIISGDPLKGQQIKITPADFMD